MKLDKTMIVPTDFMYPLLSTIATTTTVAAMNRKAEQPQHLQQQQYDVSFPSFIQSCSVGTACTTSTCSTAMTADTATSSITTSSTSTSMSTASSSLSSSERKTTPLPDNFTPGPMDVVCARGKGSSRHEGNRRFKLIIENAIPKYANTDSRIEKTLIVSEIVDTIRNNAATASAAGGGIGIGSPGFVKREGGRWWIMSDSLARDKVSQSLRDALSNKYKSSTKAKKRRKQAMYAAQQNNNVGNQDLDVMIQSTTAVSQRLQKLSKQLQQSGPKASNDTVMNLFNTANCDLLETLKQNSTLVTTFTDRYNNPKKPQSANTASASTNFIFGDNGSVDNDNDDDDEEDDESVTSV